METCLVCTHVYRHYPRIEMRQRKPGCDKVGRVLFTSHLYFGSNFSAIWKGFFLHVCTSLFLERQFQGLCTCTCIAHKPLHNPTWLTVLYGTYYPHKNLAPCLLQQWWWSFIVVKFVAFVILSSSSVHFSIVVLCNTRYADVLFGYCRTPFSCFFIDHHYFGSPSNHMLVSHRFWFSSPCSSDSRR